MKIRFFEQQKSNPELWRLNWLGLKTYGKEFTRHGLGMTCCYSIQEITEIADILKSNHIHSIVWESNDSNQTLHQTNKDQLCAILSSLPASNSAIYQPGY